MMHTIQQAVQFNHSRHKNGTGTISFDNNQGQPIASINIQQNPNDGLWYTTNQVIIPPVNPTSHIHNMKSQQYKNLEIWHQCLGHIAPTTLRSTQQVVEGIPQLPTATSQFHCPFCDIAKLQKQPTAKQTNRDAFIPGTAYHMDLGFIGGPSQNHTKHHKPQTEQRSYEGHIAYLLIINAATRYIFAFPLKSKHPLIDTIDRFLTKNGRAKRTLVTTSPKGILKNSKSFAKTCRLKGYSIEEHDYMFTNDSDQYD